MLWYLKRAKQPSDNPGHYRSVQTPCGVAHPTFHHGAWWVVTTHRAVRDSLQLRKVGRGFRCVEELPEDLNHLRPDYAPPAPKPKPPPVVITSVSIAKDPPDPRAVIQKIEPEPTPEKPQPPDPEPEEPVPPELEVEPEPPPAPKKTAAQKAAEEIDRKTPSTVRESDPHTVRAWAAWTGEEREEPEPLEPPTCLDREIGERDNDTPLSNIAVVMVLTGWRDRDRNAVVRAAKICKELKHGCHVVVVQNHEPDHGSMRAWKPTGLTRYIRRVYSNNRGYAHACNLGAKSARKTAKWVLFTQADVTWTTDSLEMAIRAMKPDTLIGPSGGYLVDADMAIISEHGRNIGNNADAPCVCDFVAGYWLLVSKQLWNGVQWDDDFFLYYEDVDFCLRATLSGAEVIVWPNLPVDHARGQTIRRRLLSKGHFELIRDQSRERFKARWAGREE